MNDERCDERTEFERNCGMAYVFDKLIMKRNKGCRAVMAGGRVISAIISFRNRKDDACR